MDLTHAKGAFFQVGTHFVLPKGLKDLSNVLQVFFPTLVEDEDVVEIKKKMNELVKGCKMSSISLIKVAGAFVNLKGITNHSKMPSLDLKVVFHTFVGSIGTW